MSQRRRHPAPARRLPAFAPRAREVDSPSGFPRHLAPTVKVSFLPPSLPPSSKRRREKAGPQQREGGEPGEAPAAASARLLPQPLTPASVRACAALPTRRGRPGERGAQREASRAGAGLARASGLLVAWVRAGRAAGIPAAFRRPSPARGTRSPRPRGANRLRLRGFPACLAWRPRPETHR